MIVSVNGRVLEDAESFHYRIATLPVGSMADVGIVRKGQKSDLQVTLIAPPEVPPREQTKVSGQNPLAGATIENLSPAVIEENNLHGIEHGVVITGIKDADTPAASVGLQAGDVILSINGTKIASVADALKALQQQATSWRISIQRGDSVLTIMVGG